MSGAVLGLIIGFTIVLILGLLVTAIVTIVGLRHGLFIWLFEEEGNILVKLLIFPVWLSLCIIAFISNVVIGLLLFFLVEDALKHFRRL